MIKKSWDKVKTTTITNCWNHCGFLENHMLTNDGDDLAVNVNKIKSKLKDLHLFAFKPSQNDESSINLMIEEFISIDETECIESLTDEDILLIIKNPEISEVTEEADAESYNIPPKQITFEEVCELRLLIFIKLYLFDLFIIIMKIIFHIFICNLILFI